MIQVPDLLVFSPSLSSTFHMTSFQDRQSLQDHQTLLVTAFPVSQSQGKKKAELEEKISLPQCQQTGPYVKLALMG